jgi:hypothetical protein
MSRIQCGCGCGSADKKKMCKLGSPTNFTNWTLGELL